MFISVTDVLFTVFFGFKVFDIDLIGCDTKLLAYNRKDFSADYLGSLVGVIMHPVGMNASRKIFGYTPKIVYYGIGI